MVAFVTYQVGVCYRVRYCHYRVGRTHMGTLCLVYLCKCLYFWEVYGLFLILYVPVVCYDAVHIEKFLIYHCGNSCHLWRVEPELHVHGSVRADRAECCFPGYRFAVCVKEFLSCFLVHEDSPYGVIPVRNKVPVCHGIDDYRVVVRKRHPLRYVLCRGWRMYFRYLEGLPLVFLVLVWRDKHVIQV